MNPRKLPQFSLSILDPRYSLRARIALIIAILTIILSVILTLITGQISAQEFDRNIGRSLAQLSSNLASQLGQIMFERRRELRLTASQSALFESTDNAGEVRLLLNQLSETNRDYAWIGWIDATGKVIAGVDGLFEGSNVSDRRWFQQGSADVTTPYIGGVQEVPELASRLPARLDNVSRRYIDLAMPIRGKDRQLIGVLGAYIDTGFLRDQAMAVERQFEKQNGLTITTTSEQGRLDVFVLDSDGTVLVGPRSYTSLRLSDAPKLALQSVTAARSGQSSYLTEIWSDTNAAFLTGYAKDTDYRGYSGLGWIVLTRQRADVALASVAQLQGLLLTLGFVFAVLFSAIGWLIAILATRPLVRVAQRAQDIKMSEMREGDTTPPLSSRADEVAVLSRTLDGLLVSLNSRNAQLRELNNDLEQLVQARTSELAVSQRFNEKIVGTVPDLVYIYDLTTGKNLYVNPSVTPLLGYSAEELRETVNHLSLEGLLHEEDRESYLSRHQHIDGCADGTLIDGVYRLKHRDGHWVWVESRETVFARNAAGQATQVFGVMQDATLRKQAETEMVEAAAADERQRLARELHDSVTQTLFSASMVAQSLPWLWGKGESVVKQNLEELSRLTRGALAEMRTLLNELRPSAIATADLTELLTHLLDAARGRTSAEFTLTCEGESNLPPEVKVAVYRIAQEALNNVTKHARAKHVQLQLRRNAGGVEMRIVDDGRGFSQELPMSDHFGLGIMQERAEEIGATLIVESRPGHGTEVRLVWQRSETSPVEVQEAQKSTTAR